MGINLTAGPILLRKSGFTAYDLSSTAPVSVTGIGFKPNLVFFFCAKAGAINASSCFGADDGTNTNTLYQIGTTTAWGANVAKSIDIEDAAGNISTAKITSMDADGFTITPSKTGTPTGSAYILYVALG